MPTCHHCRRESNAGHYDRIVHNKTALYGPFEGWRMAGRFLVAPGKAGRITPERLLGMLWEEQARVRVWRSPEKNGTMAAKSSAIVPLLRFPEL